MKRRMIFKGLGRKNCKLSGMNAADIAALIPVFGEKCENFIRAEDWIRRVDTLRITHGWTQKITMVYAAMRLRGAAAFWYETAQENLASWIQFKEELMDNFPDAMSKKEVHEILKRKKKKPDEEVELYFHKTVAIGKRAKLEDPVIMEYLIDGLETEAQKTALRSKGNVALKDLLKDMVRVCQSQQNESKMESAKPETENKVKEQVDDRRDFRDERDRYRGRFRKRNWRPRWQHEDYYEEEKTSGNKGNSTEVKEAKETEKEKDVKQDKEEQTRKKYVKKCWRCNSESHLAYACKRGGGTTRHQGK
ncbi:uncharacterized protein LOC129794781 [Lutzomyia longipalpis]|uniref:uncharacterized protein LOC129794781 n=1 Tax=Lutzomyia longipalpis TaxID=7200 RepID=UPI002483C184|nr:uncharacterized protein LOC129794781 [Lutzomyia longipalpis]